MRGTDGAGAGQILAAVRPDNRYAFDQHCRVKAIELAAALDMAASEVRLSMNFLPNAVYAPRACIRLTLATAERTGFLPEQIIFEAPGTSGSTRRICSTSCAPAGRSGSGPPSTTSARATPG